MKKFFAIMILAAMLLSGCASTSQDAETPTVEVAHSISYAEVLNNFNKMLEPLNGQYTMTSLAKVSLEDGTTCQPVMITDTLINDTYSIHLYYTQSGDVSMFTMTSNRKNYTHINFALLSFYLYESMALPEMDAQAFYDYFSLLSEEPEGTMSNEGWFVSVDTFESFLHFGGILESSL